MTDNKFKRQIAIKTNNDIINSSKYIEVEEGLSNYILTNNNDKIFRLNLIAIIVNKTKTGSITNILIDDGSGELIVRIFEENELIDKLKISETILIIGKIRVYNQEKYLSPEIIKKVDYLWLKQRKIELKNILKKQKKENKSEEKIDNSNNKRVINGGKVEETKKENIIDNVINNEIEQFLPGEKIVQLIKELDQGNGVNIEVLIEKAKINDTEKIIEKMLEMGELFQNLPGKVKIL